MKNISIAIEDIVLNDLASFSSKREGFDDIIVKVSEWSVFLGLRTIEISDNWSGQRYRAEVVYDKYLEARAKKVFLIFDFSGVRGGVPPSFANEAFGGLISRDNFEKSEVLSILKFSGLDSYMASIIYEQVVVKAVHEPIQGRDSIKTKELLRTKGILLN